MSRVKRGTISLKRRRNVLSKVKGYRFGRSTKERQAREAIAHAGSYAFAHRRDKKNDFRRLWIVRLNAALRPLGLSYSKWIGNLKKANIEVDRKILSEIARTNPESFARVMEQTKG
ncbi:MAG: 50S ribosomal protein L20 [bacterium]|jgi:large subunit ribosomal protein L20